MTQSKLTLGPNHLSGHDDYSAYFTFVRANLYRGNLYAVQIVRDGVDVGGLSEGTRDECNAFVDGWLTAMSHMEHRA